MDINQKLKKIDDYFTNVTEEQFEKDMEAIGIDELLKCVDEEEKIIEKEMYFSNLDGYLYNREIDYNISYEEGTRCQTKVTKQKKQIQEQALAS